MTLKYLFAAAALCAALPAPAAIVADTLPYKGTPDWTDIVFPDTSMTTDGTKSVLSTVQGQGVWFGWGTSYGNQPGWSPGSSSQGNHLSLKLSFSSNAADWSVYFYDGAYEAALQFSPTNCADACYGIPALSGVNLLFGNPGTQTTAITLFVGLTMTEENLFEFLLRDGIVSYRINGLVYGGPAYKTGGGPLLVIGDGSGSTRTGVGSMTVHGLSIDTAPTQRVLSSTAVPEPSSWAMMILGSGLAGAWLRRPRYKKA